MSLSCLYTTFPVFWGTLELKKYKRTVIIENWDKPELLQHRASWITTINDTDTKFSKGLLMLFRPYGSYFFLCLACLLQWRPPWEHCRNSLAVKEKKLGRKREEFLNFLEEIWAKVCSTQLELGHSDLKRGHSDLLEDAGEARDPHTSELEYLIKDSRVNMMHNIKKKSMDLHGREKW